MHMRMPLLPVAVLILVLAALSPACLSFDDYDGDGIYDEDDPDDDNDGMPDKWERKYDLQPKNKTDAAADLDGDGLTNLQEYKNGTDPGSDDTDGDLLPDRWEVENAQDPTNATNADRDEDGDGLTTLEEYWNSTDPNSTDTDGDGIWDGYEVRMGLDPRDPRDAARDDDLDGLNNTEEFSHLTDPGSGDTDSDLLPDGWEVRWGTDPLVDDADDNPDDDGWDANHDYEVGPEERFTNIMELQNGTDPLDGDTDGDGMDDGYEAHFGLDPLDDADAVADPDGDGLISRKEFLADTSPVDPDTDGDGIDDAFELEWGLSPISASDGSGDLDGDAFTNLQEYLAGTNLTHPDTDGDGVMDGHDVVPLFDIAIRVTVTRIAFDQMVEGAIDNPGVGKAYEVYVRIVVAGMEVWSKPVNTLELELATNISITVDVPDELWNISISIGLWENDTAESAGLNADDHLDIDGTSDDLDCDIVYNMVTATWRGDTTEGTTDGHADGLPQDSQHPDGVVDFVIEVVAV